jgi:hypothetical protein
VSATNALGTGAASAQSNAVTPTSGPDTIFGSATPATIDSGDPNSVELGVKFSAEVAGRRAHPDSHRTLRRRGSLCRQVGAPAEELSCCRHGGGPGGRAELLTG